MTDYVRCPYCCKLCVYDDMVLVMDPVNRDFVMGCAECASKIGKENQKKEEDERMTAEFLKKILSEDPPPDFGEPSNQEEIDGEMYPQFYRTFGTDEICPRCGKEIAYTLLEYHPYQHPRLQDTLIMFCDCGRDAQTFQTVGCPFYIQHDDMREFMHMLCEHHLELLERYDEQMRSKQKGMNGGERMTNGSNGYCPHDGMGRFRCDGCGGTLFTSYAQTCPADRHRLWTYEYTCLGCGRIMGMDYRVVDE